MSEAGTKEAQAIAIAGAIAELGIQELVHHRGSASGRLIARKTDLPRVLFAANPGDQLRSKSPRISITVDAGGFHWQADDPQVVNLLRAAILP